MKFPNIQARINYYNELHKKQAKKNHEKKLEKRQEKQLKEKELLVSKTSTKGNPLAPLQKFDFQKTKEMHERFLASQKITQKEKEFRLMQKKRDQLNRNQILKTQLPKKSKVKKIPDTKWKKFSDMKAVFEKPAVKTDQKAAKKNPQLPKKPRKLVSSRAKRFEGLTKTPTKESQVLKIGKAVNLKKHTLMKRDENSISLQNRLESMKKMKEFRKESKKSKLLFLEKQDILSITSNVDVVEELFSLLQNLFPEVSFNYQLEAERRHMLLMKSRNLFIGKNMVLVNVEGRKKIGYSQVADFKPQLFEKKISTSTNPSVMIFLDEPSIKRISPDLKKKYGLKDLEEGQKYFFNLKLNKETGVMECNLKIDSELSLNSDKRDPLKELRNLYRSMDLVNSSLLRTDLETLDTNDLIEEIREIQEVIKSLYSKSGEEQESWKDVVPKYISDYGNSFDKRFVVVESKKGKKHLVSILGKAKYKYTIEILEDGKIMMPMLWIPKKIAKKMNLAKYGYVPLAEGTGGTVFFGYLFDPDNMQNPEITVQKKSNTALRPEHLKSFLDEFHKMKHINSEYMIMPEGMTKAVKKRFVQEKDSVSHILKLSKYGDLANIAQRLRVTGFYDFEKQVLSSKIQPTEEEKKLLKIIKQIRNTLALDFLKGVRDMHASGIVHRDLKLENIFVSEGSLVGDLDQSMHIDEFSKKVNHFKDLKLNGRLEQKNNSEEFEVFRRKGTLSFVHPDFFGSVSEVNLDKLDPVKCDLYSCALVLCDLLFSEANDIENSHEEKLFSKDGKEYAKKLYGKFKNNFANSKSELEMRKMIMALMDGEISLDECINILEKKDILAKDELRDSLSDLFDKKELAGKELEGFNDKFEFQEKKETMHYQFLPFVSQLTENMFKIYKKYDIKSPLFTNIDQSKLEKDEANIFDDDDDDDDMPRRKENFKKREDLYENSQVWERYIKE